MTPRAPTPDEVAEETSKRILADDSLLSADVLASATSCSISGAKMLTSLNDSSGQRIDDRTAGDVNHAPGVEIQWRSLRSLGVGGRVAAEPRIGDHGGGRKEVQCFAREGIPAASGGQSGGGQQQGVSARSKSFFQKMRRQRRQRG
jgi:hypothetical protein